MGRWIAASAVVLVLAGACGDDTAPVEGEAAPPRTAAPDGPAPTGSDTTTTDPTTTSQAPESTMIGDPLPTPTPTVERPPDTGSIFYQGTGFDLSLVGYQQAEYFVAGTARSFAPMAGTELGRDGKWEVEPVEDADYRTRAVVVTPTDPDAFSGTVVVEWLNVSGGLDAAPNWTMSHVEQIREGHAWVGVSAQEVGIEGGTARLDIPLVLFLKGQQPERYGTLDHPGDSFSYDIFSQVAQALRDPDGAGVDMLGGLRPERLLAVGESQSAFRLTTYINGLDPLAQLFDGFLVHSRGGGSAGLAQDPQPQEPTAASVLIRDDVRVPVLTFQTDTDIFRLGFEPDRQPDSDRFRLWEVAGTAHGDLYSIALDVGAQDLGDDPSVAEVREVSAPIPGIIECGAPINSGPQHWVMNAALYALDRWADGGPPPPSAPVLETAGGGFVVDEHGNARGGVRTAWVDVPVATLTGEPPGGGNFCGLFGTTELFDDAKLATLYPDKATYLEAMTASVEQSVSDGFLRPADGELILANAAADRIGSTG